MEANDYRLDNIVKCNGILGHVDWIQKESIAIRYSERQNDLTNGCIINPCKIEPIPLTEEWLMKMGATKIGEQFILDRFRLNYRKDYEFWYVVDVTSLSYMTKIDSVHHLQNFYHGMNQIELNITG